MNQPQLNNQQSIFNPFARIRMRKKGFADVRTLQTTFLEKIADTFEVISGGNINKSDFVFGEIQTSMGPGLLDYLTLGMLRLPLFLINSLTKIYLNPHPFLIKPFLYLGFLIFGLINGMANEIIRPLAAATLTIATLPIIGVVHLISQAVRWKIATSLATSINQKMAATAATYIETDLPQPANVAPRLNANTLCKADIVVAHHTIHPQTNEAGISVTFKKTQKKKASAVMGTLFFGYNHIKEKKRDKLIKKLKTVNREALNLVSNTF